MYKTSDTPLATFLIHQGFTLDIITYKNGQAFFVFPNNSDVLQQSVSQYKNGTAIVNLRSYIDINRDLIKRIKEGI